MKALGFSDMSRYNRLNVLNLIKNKGQISRADLVKLTKLTGPSISRIINDLMEEGLVTETGIGESSGGRKPILLEFNASARTVIGLDIRPDKVMGIACDLAATRLKKRQTDFAEDIPTERKLNLALNMAQELYLEAEKIAPVIGLGIAVPGVVDNLRGIVRYSAPMGWRNVDLNNFFGQALKVPISVDNVTRCVALGEKWFGNAKDKADFIYLYVGEGIGAGIIAKGQLYHGSRYSAAEIGHTTVEYKGEKCRCGNHGCLELYTSLRALKNRLETILGISINSKAELWNLLQDENSTAWKAVEETLSYLGTGIANMINIFNPETIVIGGWPLNTGVRGLEYLKGVVQSRAMEGLVDGVSMVYSGLDEEGPLIGAYTLILESFFNPLLLKSEQNLPNKGVI
ncbi:MAG: ROK family protein [Zhaonellaceae bacterium]|jgi:N-acetylglucosamine repressor|nr:ROK family transcriptional regulator [Clostridia bacterium]